MTPKTGPVYPLRPCHP